MSGRKRWTHLDQMVGEGIVDVEGSCLANSKKLTPRTPALPHQDRMLANVTKLKKKRAILYPRGVGLVIGTPQ